ncbi:tetratricopeptide repeat protein [Streptomyces sp. CA-210063]|uniref:tetratricopeptide repeat protein n=1 Tax=Streptomyces sp. CA-210063 TaxID=2801029 RepID=UPI00214C85F9|nr:tetratricopeptide repeat protein [Streptomyces sp. CA-210063]UUU35792.1 tetratricopeptide repeat protein [Streptomyces sp. CA-210063]
MRAEVARLAEALEEGNAAVATQAAPTGVVVGTGGVGKTQLAADYARTSWEAGGLDILVWITASDRLSVVTNYAQAGVELCQGDPENPESAARTFLAWLAPKGGHRASRWLIVLDDVADPDHLRGLWPPASPYGRTLVTTRRRDAALSGQGRRPIEVGLFTAAESVAYLTASLAPLGRSEPVDQLAALASDLGYLPLALAQAAAYLIDSNETVAAYRALLADRTTTLTDATPDRLPDDQVLPLAAAWSLSIDRADSLRPVGLARPMLHLLALLDANGIPEDVLTCAPALAHLSQYRTQTSQNLAAEAVSSRDAVQALRALHRLSLIDHAPTTPHQTVRIHQLIQRATRDTLIPEQQHQFARTAADALMAIWHDNERDTAQVLRANAEALIRHVEEGLYRPDAHDLLYRFGRSIGDSGQVAVAASYFEQLSRTAIRHLGPDHPDSLTARHSFARWRGEAGDPEGAEATLVHLLDDMLRVLGPDHPHTLTTRASLADWRGEAWDPVSAAAAFTELLDDMLRVLGPDHPHTLTTRSQLARWTGEAGNPDSAAAAFAELLDDMLRVLGPDHPHTLTTRSQLTRWRGAAGDTRGAAAAFTELLNDMLRVLGPDHPHTLATRSRLARWTGEAGNPGSAAAAFAELLDDMLRVLGPDHPHTLSTQSQLTRWREEAADAVLAENSANVSARVAADDQDMQTSAQPEDDDVFQRIFSQFKTQRPPWAAADGQVMETSAQSASDEVFERIFSQFKTQHPPWDFADDQDMQTSAQPEDDDVFERIFSQFKTQRPSWEA